MTNKAAKNTTRMNRLPNPGSEAAIKSGCSCAVMDNNHGKWAPWPPSGWWITEGCPVHAPVKVQS